MDKILIVDMSWLYVRIYHVMKHIHESEGMNIIHKRHMQGLIRFFSLISKNNKDFEKIFIVLDCELGNTDSKELFEDYKSGRVKDEGLYKNFDKFITLLSLQPRITVLRNDKREADDVIAFLALKYSKKNKVTIYSADKDFLQLTAKENISVSEKYEKGKFLILSDGEIFGKFKNSKKEDFTRISSSKSDLIKYRVFKGDASDKIPPAIPRLPDKDIIYIINNYWLEEGLSEDTWGNIMKRAFFDEERPKIHDKIVENNKNISRNFQLMNLMDKHGDEVIKNETKKISAKGLTKNSTEILSIVKEFDVQDYLGILD